MTIQKALCANPAPRKPGAKPDCIVLHATRTPAADFLRRCRQPDARVPHFLIAGDASVCQLLELQSAATTGGGDPHASVSVLFCTGAHGELSDAQLDAAVALLRFIREQCRACFHVELPLGAQTVRLHRDLAPDVGCPGTEFPLDRLLSRLCPPPPERFRARLVTVYAKSDAQNAVRSLRQAGFQTASMRAERGGYVVFFADHDNRDEPARTVQLLRRLGWNAAVERVAKG